MLVATFAVGCAPTLVALQPEGAAYLQRQPRIRWRVLAPAPLKIYSEAAAHAGGFLGPAVGVSVAESEGEPLTRSGTVKDPSVVASELFVRAATASSAVLEKDSAAAAPGSPESKTWPAVLDFKTTLWSAWYPPFEDNYALTYQVVARLLRVVSGSEEVLWQGSCRFMNAPRDGPTYEQLVGGGAKGLNRLLREATVFCAAELAAQLRRGPGQFQPTPAQFGLRVAREPDSSTSATVNDEPTCMQQCVDALRDRAAPKPNPFGVGCAEDQTPELCCRWTTCVDAPSAAEAPARR